MTRRRLPRRHLFAVFTAIVTGALLLRFVSLGWRVFHWDEARVGYWTLRYLETGIWEYRAIVHGPVLFHVNEILFGLFGASDAVARSFVALVGGLLPLTAWLFRSRLDDLEMAGLALVLALEPALLYYGRFMRSDLLVAGFALVTLGFAIRFLDERENVALYLAVLSLGLAFGTKEIIVVYLGVWGGAMLLLLDHRLFVAREVGESWKGRAKSTFHRVYSGVQSYRWPIVIGLFEFLLVILLLYAPRPDLYQAFSDPTRLPGVFNAATIESAQELFDIWIDGGHEHSYVAYLTDALQTTAYVSLPTFGFAILGFLSDRYTGDQPRDLISFGFYWGVTIYLLYPAITDISAPWSIVHAIVPLSIPAAVGIKLVINFAIEAWDGEDRVTFAITAIVLMAVVAQVGITAFQTSYQSPQADDNPLVQYGQPGGHMQATLEDIETIAAQNEGTDVLFYGDHFAVPDESVADQPPASSNWLNRLPIAWYLERANVTTESANTPDEISAETPVVITRVEHYSDVAAELPDHEAQTYEITSHGTETVIFVDRSQLDNQERG